MSRTFTSKPCPGCGLTSNLAPNTVCLGCQEAIRDHRRLKTASEALGDAEFYSLAQGIAPRQAGDLASCVDFEVAFVDLLTCLCITKPKNQAGFSHTMDGRYHDVHLGEPLKEPVAFLATGKHEGTQAPRYEPGLIACIHRLFTAVDHMIRQARAQGQIKGQDLLAQLNAGELSMAGLDQKTRDAERVILGRG